MEDIEDVPMSLVSGDIDDDLLASSVRFGGDLKSIKSSNLALKNLMDHEAETGSQFSNNLDELRAEALNYK